MTRRIYALTDDQLDSLLQFLEWLPNAGTEDQKQQPGCPLPILGDDNNLTRVDTDVAIPMHHVFRDRWERKVKWRDYSHYSMCCKRCVRNAVDYPELKDRRPLADRPNPEQQAKPILLGDLLKKRHDGKGSATQLGST